MQLRLIKLSLIISVFFTACSVMVLGTDFTLSPSGTIFGLHPFILQNSPFSNFLLPGIISLLIVGGSSLFTLLLLLENNNYALPAALVTGIITICWACFIALATSQISWINIVYWVLGFKITVVSLYIQKSYDDIK